MKELVLCDDSSPNLVVPLCNKYNLGIEIQGFHNPEMCKNYKSILRNYKNLLPNNISKYFHAPFADLCLGSKTEKIVKATKFYFNYAYKISKKLKVKRITVHHGYVPATSYLPAWINRSVIFWNKFLNKKDIPFDMENLLELDPQCLKDITDKVNSKNLGLNLDIGHAHCNSRTPVTEWIKILGPRITYVHLHDNHGEIDEHLGLGMGNMDIKKVLNALNKYAPNAIWALECKLEYMEDSIKYLKENKFI